jgi:hypothetical protein
MLNVLSWRRSRRAARLRPLAHQLTPRSAKKLGAAVPTSSDRDCADNSRQEASAGASNVETGLLDSQNL